MKTLKQIAVEAIQDPTGRISHARIISMLVAIAATVFIWKLIIVGGMTVDYFIAYLAYGTGHQTLNKFLDFRNGQVRANSTATDSSATRTPSTQNIDTDDFDTPPNRNRRL